MSQITPFCQTNLLVISAPPELVHIDSIDYQVSSEVDVWALGCMIVEAAVWVVFGPRGRRRLRHDLQIETLQVPNHRALVHGYSFHDGKTVLQYIARDTVKNIEENGRRVDTITPAMVDLMVRHALTEKQDRDHAGQLLNKMRRKVFATPPNPTAVGPSQPPSSQDMEVIFPKVTIDELVKWMEERKMGNIKQLSGWDSAKELLRGRDFVSTSIFHFPLPLHQRNTLTLSIAASC